MKVFIDKDYHALSERAAGIMLSEMTRDRRVNVSITAGASPVGVYERVIKALGGANEGAKATAFDNVHYYNFDEIDIPGEERGVTRKALDEGFFDKARIPEERIHTLTCKNWQSHQAAVEAAGGLDFMLLGMGGDGHFCGNMPGETRFAEHIYKIQVKPEYPWYEAFLQMKITPTPTFFVTMGAAAIMKVRRLVMIVNGEGKAAVVKRFFESRVTEEFPSSVLKLHPNFTLILDRDAARLL